MNCRNYAEIIAELEKVQAAADEDGKRAISEAIDIVYDYQRQASTFQSMIDKFIKPQRPTEARQTYAGNGGKIYLCPDCRKRVKPHNAHCHRCGQKLTWEGIELPQDDWQWRPRR